MPNIVITEKQQAVQIARAAQDWDIEFTKEVEEEDFDGFTRMVPADIVHFNTGGVVRFVVAGMFDREGLLETGVLLLWKLELGRGGTEFKLQSTETTQDWDLFTTWLKCPDGLFAALAQQEKLAAEAAAANN